MSTEAQKKAQRKYWEKHKEYYNNKHKEYYRIDKEKYYKTRFVIDKIKKYIVSQFEIGYDEDFNLIEKTEIDGRELLEMIEALEESYSSNESEEIK